LPKRPAARLCTVFRGQAQKSATIYHGFANHQELKNRLCRSTDKELAADYPMEPLVYKITVTPFEGASGQTKFIVVEPQVHKEHLQKHVFRQAQAFAVQVPDRLGLGADQV
jgi:hypothetical protein